MIRAELGKWRAPCCCSQVGRGRRQARQRDGRRHQPAAANLPPESGRNAAAAAAAAVVLQTRHALAPLRAALCADHDRNDRGMASRKLQGRSPQRNAVAFAHGRELLGTAHDLLRGRGVCAATRAQWLQHERGQTAVQTATSARAVGVPARQQRPASTERAYRARVVVVAVAAAAGGVRAGGSGMTRACAAVHRQNAAALRLRARRTPCRRQARKARQGRRGTVTHRNTTRRQTPWRGLGRARPS